MSTSSQTADTMLFNGKVITADANFSIVEAVAISGDKFLAVGNDEDIKKLVGPDTKQIDLKGQTVVPGFIDGHQHFTGAGGIFLKQKSGLSLANVKSIQDIKDVIKKAVEKTKPGEWIVTTPIGEPDKHDLVPEVLNEKRLPNRWVKYRF